MKCLGLDVGSTTIKGAVLDLELHAVDSTVTRPFPAPISGLAPGWFEVSPAAIVEQAHAVVHELLRAAPDAKQIYFSGQMGGTILVDRSGEPVTNYLSWRDQRASTEQTPGTSYLDAVHQRWGTDILVSLGNELQPGSATSLLFWLAENRLLPEDSIPVSIGDFVIGQMCRTVPRMHVTQAIGMLKLDAADWHREAFELLGVGENRFPELSRRVEAAGTFQTEGRTLEVFGTYGDQQCALRGAGLQRGELSINVSTGSQVSRRSASFEPGPYQTRFYFEGDLLHTLTHLPAGRSLNVLVDLLTELAAAEGIALNDPWKHIVAKASAVDATDLEIDLTFFAGPLGSTGAIRGMTTENLTVGQLFHASFRSMADNYALCAKRLDPDFHWKAVAISGGMTRSIPLLRAMIQQRFDAPLRETIGDDTMLGLLEIAREEILSRNDEG